MEGRRKGSIWAEGAACRMRAKRHGVSPEAIEAAKRAANANVTRTRRRGGPRGKALPYRRTANVLAGFLEARYGIPADQAAVEAEEALRPALAKAAA